MRERGCLCSAGLVLAGVAMGGPGHPRQSAHAMRENSVIYDEERQCWWFAGACHRPRRRDDVVGLCWIVCMVGGLVLALLGVFG
jgi:hypothetical protein